jgi:hypothetical protein
MRFVVTAVTVGVLCGLVSAADAQDVQREARDVPHRFFDRTNIALTVIESGALLADGITTQHALNRYPESFREADPIARPFVNRGWPGQILGGALFVSADVGLRYWLHRTNHHRIERWLPMVLTTYGTVCAIHNAHELRSADREWRFSVSVHLTR